MPTINDPSPLTHVFENPNAEKEYHALIGVAQEEALPEDTYMTLSQDDIAKAMDAVAAPTTPPPHDCTAQVAAAERQIALRMAGVLRTTLLPALTKVVNDLATTIEAASTPQP